LGKACYQHPFPRVLSKNLRIQIYNTAVLRVFSYCHEIGSLVLKEDAEAKREEGTRNWRKMRDEELHSLSSPNIIRAVKPRIMGWAVHV
jgi:hypothetical protein